jgi:hypothetical protein
LYSVDSHGGILLDDYNSAENSHCKKFDLANLADLRQVKARSDRFLQTDEGTYTIKIRGAMFLNNHKKSQFAEVEYTKKIQADCADEGGNIYESFSDPPNALGNLLIARIGENASLSIDASTLIKWTFKHTCPFSLKIVDESGQEPSWLELNAAKTEI